jgi:hypothetical protein
MFARRFLGNSPHQVSIMNSDDIAFTVLSDGDRLVDNKTSGYRFTLPTSWYFEKKEGRGVAIYPNYHPNTSVLPECKIEISVFPDIASENANNWIIGRLHEDPTVTVSELSRTAINVSGASTTIEWRGTLDEITTTLVYVFTEGNAYEIVPSVLDIKSNNGNLVCDAALKSFLENIRFSKNAQ